MQMFLIIHHYVIPFTQKIFNKLLKKEIKISNNKKFSFVP